MSWGPFDLTGRAAVVTGSAQGIGLGCARRLREAGAHVLVADIDHEASEHAALDLAEVASSGDVATWTGDIARPDNVEAMIRRCVEEFGSIDVLVNNAGIYPAAAFPEITPEHIRRVFAVNVEGLILATRAAALSMIENGIGGAIVNLASMGALRGVHPGLVTYGASKGAVISFTTRAAGALAARGIRVNAIAPGTIETDGAAVLGSPGGTDPDAAFARIPLGRVGRPDDIATVALFLASDAAAYVTGTTIVVDGGAMLA